MNDRELLKEFVRIEKTENKVQRTLRMRQPGSLKIPGSFESASNARSANLLVGCMTKASVRDVPRSITDGYGEIPHSVTKLELPPQ